MKNILIEKEFFDIEHDGDKEPIRNAIDELGGTIKDETYNYDAEHWIVVVEVTIENKTEFWNRVDKLVQEHYES